MGVDFIHNPRELSFTGNPLSVTLNGENYISTPGIKAVLIIQHTDTLVNGESFNISFMDYSLDFEVVSTSVDDSGLQILAGSTTVQIIAQLDDNYYLSKYYDISLVDTDKIQIEAKEAGSDYDLINILTACAGLTEVSNEAGVDQVTEENYKILLQIMLESTYCSGTYEKVAEMYLDADEGGNAEASFNEILKRLFTNTELPALNSFGFNICYHIVKRFYLNVAEVYGDPAQTKKLIASDIYYILDGKLPVNLFPGAGFHQYVIVNKCFLYTGPQTRETWASAREYLYYFNPLVSPILLPPFNLQLRVNIYYTDGTDQEETIDTYLSPVRNQVYIIPVGHDYMALDSFNPSKTIHHYNVEVHLCKGSTFDYLVARPITFNLVPAPRFKREFLFRNRYGAFQTLLTTGKQSNDYKTTRQEYQRELQDDYTMQDAEIKSLVTETEDIYTCSTGFKSMDEVRELKQCLETENFFLLHDVDYVRCRVVAGSFKISNENNDLFFIEFDYKFAFTDTVLDDPGILTNLNYYSHDYSDSYKH